MKYRIILINLLVIIVIGIVWEKASADNNNLRVLISSPSAISNYFTTHAGFLTTSFWVTLQEAFLGLLLAAVFCFGITTLCFYIPSLLSYLLPIMIASQVIPLITLAPLFFILFGGGIMAKVMMSALLCFFPIFINMAQGIRSIDKNIHELLYIYNATTRQKIRHIYFNLSLPNIMAGLKIAATLAVIGAIVSEFNGADKGLGKNLFLSAKRLEPELMMTSLFLAALMGAIMYGLIYFIERKLGKWYLQTDKVYEL